jgi:orotidine-5'-phosphate decarboxylase
VTVLTSLQDNDLQTLGINEPITSLVPRLAKLAENAGLDGVVCSAHEVAVIRTVTQPDFLTVTPGIRLAGDNKQDQQRTMTPRQAREAGSDYLVIGRSITQAKEPLQVLQNIAKDLCHQCKIK